MSILDAYQRLINERGAYLAWDTAHNGLQPGDDFTGTVRLWERHCVATGTEKLWGSETTTLNWPYTPRATLHAMNIAAELLVSRWAAEADFNIKELAIALKWRTQLLQAK